MATTLLKNGTVYQSLRIKIFQITRGTTLTKIGLDDGLQLVNDVRSLILKQQQRYILIDLEKRAHLCSNGPAPARFPSKSIPKAT